MLSERSAPSGLLEAIAISAGADLGAVLSYTDCLLQDKSIPSPKENPYSDIRGDSG